jgi:hypothetical protein
MPLNAMTCAPGYLDGWGAKRGGPGPLRGVGATARPPPVEEIGRQLAVNWPSKRRPELVSGARVGAFSYLDFGADVGLRLMPDESTSVDP